MIMKNYSLKKKIFAGLLILGALSAFPLYRAFAPGTSNKLPLIDGEISTNDAHQALARITNEGLNVTDAMRQELNTEHDRLLAELQQAFPLPDNQWEAMYKRLDAIIDSDDLMGNQTTIKKSAKPLAAIAQEVLATTGINPERVIIEIVEKPMSACDACAGQCFKDGKVAHFLQLNSVRLEEKELPVQQALLKHECMHLLNYDGLRHVFIESLLKKNGIEESVYRTHPAFCAYAKHLEFRADLFASAYDGSFADGLLQGIKNHMEQYPNPPVSLNHPTDQQRYTAIANLIKYMDVEKEITVA